MVSGGGNPETSNGVERSQSLYRQEQSGKNQVTVETELECPLATTTAQSAHDGYSTAEFGSADTGGASIEFADHFNRQCLDQPGSTPVGGRTQPELVLDGDF